MCNNKGSISCDGATAATVFAGVASLFAGVTLDTLSFLDLVVFVIMWISVKKDLPGLGAFGTGLGTVLAVTEPAKSIKDECP